MRAITSGVLAPGEFGWKAHYLSLLSEAGMPVPTGVALAHDEFADGLEVFDTLLTALGSGYRDTIAVAVRSSGVAEDSHAASHAGSLRTHLGRYTATELADRMADVRASAGGNMPVGILVQEFADLSYGGVAFSMHPLTFKRGEHFVEWTATSDPSVVSGVVTADALTIDAQTGNTTGTSWPGGASNLEFIRTALCRLEALLSAPVDVEWGIERASGAVMLLQVRPIVLPRPGTVVLDSPESFRVLPAVIRDHPKIKLRRTAQDYGVQTSAAVVNVFVDSAMSADPPSADQNETVPDSCVGRSVVLLHPATLKSKIVREFTAINRFDVEFFTEGCRRYSIRRYPGFGTAVSATVEVAARGLTESWLAVVLQQDIYDPVATGIIRGVSDGYVMDIGIGHFVPKGYVTTSTFLIDNRLSICRAVRRTQERAYRFINGHVVKEEPPESQLNLSEDEVLVAARALAPLASAQSGLALEFGMLRVQGGIRAYLIDAAESDPVSSTLTCRAVSSGIVSPGAAAGLVRLAGRQGYEGLDLHLLDQHPPHTPHGAAIYLAELASVDLLPLVYTAGPGCGFVFAQASVLGHLSVVLRERGIAAVRVGDEMFAELQNVRSLRIDTTDRHAAIHDLDSGCVWELS